MNSPFPVLYPREIVGWPLPGGPGPGLRGAALETEDVTSGRSLLGEAQRRLGIRGNQSAIPPTQLRFGVPGSWLQGRLGALCGVARGGPFPRAARCLVPGGHSTLFSGGPRNCAKRGAVGQAARVTCLLLLPGPHAASSRIAVQGGPGAAPTTQHPAPSTQHPAGSHTAGGAFSGGPDTHRGRAGEHKGQAGPQEAGRAGRRPLLRRPGRPWDVDQEAVVPPPTPPPMSGLPGREPDLFLCAGARLVEERPPGSELGQLQRGEQHLASQTLSAERPSQQLSQCGYGTLHSLCPSLSSQSASPAPPTPTPPRAGEQAAGGPGPGVGVGGGVGMDVRGVAGTMEIPCSPMGRLVDGFESQPAARLISLAQKAGLVGRTSCHHPMNTNKPPPPFQANLGHL